MVEAKIILISLFAIEEYEERLFVFHVFQLAFQVKIIEWQSSMLLKIGTKKKAD